MNTHAVDAFHKMVRSEAVCRVDVVPARRHEHLELPGDGPAGSDDDDPPDVSGKACAGGAVLAAAVHGVPRDQHRHDTGLAGSGSHADRKAHQVAAPPARTLAKFTQFAAIVGCDLGQVHDGLDGLALGPERAVSRPFSWRATPVLKERTRGAGRASPSSVTPVPHQSPEALDEQGVVDLAVGVFGQQCLHWCLKHRGRRLNAAHGEPATQDFVDGILLVSGASPVPIRLLVGAMQRRLRPMVLQNQRTAVGHGGESITEESRTNPVGLTGVVEQAKNQQTTDAAGRVNR